MCGPLAIIASNATAIRKTLKIPSQHCRDAQIALTFLTQENMNRAVRIGREEMHYNDGCSLE